jgi:hypothetical protein
MEADSVFAVLLIKQDVKPPPTLVGVCAANAFDLPTIPEFARSDVEKAWHARSPDAPCSAALNSLGFSFLFSPDLIALLANASPETDRSMAFRPSLFCWRMSLGT